MNCRNSFSCSWCYNFCTINSWKALRMLAYFNSVMLWMYQIESYALYLLAYFNSAMLWSVSNGLHSESPLQTCRQSNGQCKSLLPVLTSGPKDLARSSRYRRHRLKAHVSFNVEKADARRNRCISFRRNREDAGSRNASLMLISQ
jgi:hypothetical protein